MHKIRETYAAAGKAICRARWSILALLIAGPEDHALNCGPKMTTVTSTHAEFFFFPASGKLNILVQETNLSLGAVLLPPPIALVAGGD